MPSVAARVLIAGPDPRWIAKTSARLVDKGWVTGALQDAPLEAGSGRLMVLVHGRTPRTILQVLAQRLEQTEATTPVVVTGGFRAQVMSALDVGNQPPPVFCDTDDAIPGALSAAAAAADRHEIAAAALVGRSRPILEVRRLLAQVAASDATVLLLGETGTGKELAARCLHRMSPRTAAPFVPVNCGGLPTELIESELFGHERGAFTGAISSRAGRFELADRGTLFLDELGEAPAELQVKLLRVLETGSVERLGSVRAAQVDVRVVAATHQDLAAQVEVGRFRADLRYRLDVFPVTLPPLRERREDIPLLAATFGRRLADRTGRAVSLEPDALAALSSHDWPGNVRQLANAVERLSILYPDRPIGAAEVAATCRVGMRPPPPRGRASLPTDGSLAADVARLERQAIRDALAASGGVVADAARRLGLKRTTLAEKIRRLQPAAALCS